MLFEPTYITPDVRNGLGNGVVNVEHGITVRWRVNGQPYMVSYKIDILANDAESTLLYTTNKMPTYSPVYAFDAEGNPTFFTASILASALNGVLSNGNEYKLQITQWWSADDYIVQNSPSVFLARSYASIAVNAIVEDAATPEEQVDGPEQVAGPGVNDGNTETDEQKAAILEMVEQLAFTTDDAMDDYLALEAALYPPAVLVSIGAVFEQGGATIYDNAPLSSLRPMLTVTAYYDDLTEHPVDDYTLTGTLTAGTCTITVSYQGETTTFTVFITHIPLIHSVDYTFTGTYSQAEYDGLTFIRWQLAVLGEEDDPLYDSGNLYGVSLLEMTYYGFFTGVNYAVRLTGQTQNGVDIDSGWYVFSASYEMQTIDGGLTATAVCGGVNLNWTGLSYILGRAIGTATVTNNDILEIAEGSYVVWNTSNGSPLNLYPPLSFIFSGSIFGGINPVRAAMTTTLFTIGQSPSTNNISLKATRELLYLVGPGVVWKIYQFPQLLSPEYYVRVVLTPQTWYAVCIDTAASGRVNVIEIPAPISIGNVKSVSVGGGAPCAVDYVEILHGTASDALVWQIMADNSTYEPEWKENNYLVANFSDGTLNAGRYSVDADVTRYDVYRRTASDNVLSLAARLPLRGDSSFYDYTVKNGQDPYEWVVFPVRQVGDNLVYEGSILSDPVTVCFWDWMILECSPTATKNIYEVHNIYRFGKNLQSGSGSNNNSPAVRPNLTRYPTVQKAYSQYQSGSLTSLIGVVSADGSYSDTITLRDAIYNLSVSTKTLFLKSRKGELLHIALSGPISAITMDNSAQQAQSMTIPWVEIGSAKNVSLIGFSAL